MVHGFLSSQATSFAYAYVQEPFVHVPVLAKHGDGGVLQTTLAHGSHAGQFAHAIVRWA